MALTAREWILLPQQEQEDRKGELSPHECFLLRTELDYIHFSEDEKKNMSQEKREAFLHPKEYTEEEKEAFNRQCREIFEKILKKNKNDNTTSQ